MRETKLAQLKRLPGSEEAFSLMELCLVIAVLAVFMVLLYPAAQNMRKKALGFKCVTHLRQISAAIDIYTGQNSGYLPVGYAKVDGVVTIWSTVLAPLLPGENESRAQKMGVFFCPSTSLTKEGIFKRDADTWRNDFAANSYVLASVRRKRATLPSQAVVVFDGGGTGTPTNRQKPRHMEKINVLFLDGHVETLAEMPPAQDRVAWPKP